MNINSLIDNVKKGDVQGSNNAFNSIMANKINGALDAHKKDIAGAMYGTPEVNEQEPKSDEEI
jgi:hypothetical protein